MENELEVSLGDYVDFICPTSGVLQMFIVQDQEYENCNLEKGKFLENLIIYENSNIDRFYNYIKLFWKNII